jgi:replication-associated recombination protein RarA
MSTPPVTTLAPGVRPNNLPALSTALIGRDGLLESVLAMLRQPGVRLATLTGPGGVGKTRLGLQIAADLIDEMEDGVSVVALAAIRDAGLVAPTIAATIEGRPVRSSPSSGGSRQA